MYRIYRLSANADRVSRLVVGPDRATKEDADKAAQDYRDWYDARFPYHGFLVQVEEVKQSL